MDNKSVKKLEDDLWESADLFRAGSKLTSQQYCMPVLGLIFLRFAYKPVLAGGGVDPKEYPMRNGRMMPVKASNSLKRACFIH